jgi:hypothetical protein
MELMGYQVTSRRASNHVVVETYTPDRIKRNGELADVVLLAGANVTPREWHPKSHNGYPRERGNVVYGALRRTHYLGAFPALFASETGARVHVVYQSGVSGKPYKKGVISLEANRAQIAAAGEMTEGKLWYPVSHSWSTVPHIEMCVRGEYDGVDMTKVLPGIVSSPMTTAADALTHNDSLRRFGYIGPQWLSLFEKLQHYSLPALYPLAAQKWHDGDFSEGHNPNWGAARIINTASAADFLPIDTVAMLKATQDRHMKPYVLLTFQDRVFSPEGQLEIARLLGSDTDDVKGILSGHRWFTYWALPNLLPGLTAHFDRCVERRHLGIEGMV